MEVKRVGVLPAYRKHGLGQMILAALEAAGREAGNAGAQLVIRADQLRLIEFFAGFGYARADDVELTTVNPLSPPPFDMRKFFKD